MNKRNLCVVNNFHGLLIYLICNDPKVKKTDFVMSNYLSRVVRLPSNSLFPLPVYKFSSLKGMCYYFYYYYIYQWLVRIRFLNHKHFGQDCTYFSSILNKEAIIIEDGDRTYIGELFPRSKLKNIIFPFTRFKKMHGLDKHVKHIVLSKNVNLNSPLYDKRIHFSFENEWNKLDDDEKKSITSVFGLDTIYMKNLADQVSGRNVVLTQPISEDGFVTEDEKVDLYKKLVEHYGIENPIIKPHPREKTDYASFGFDVITNVFPSQFFLFYSIKFKSALTLFSSSIHEIPSEKVILAGTSFHHALTESFGIIDEKVIFHEK
ncbi:glycosyltransferase family 52 [Shewanella indica]|uniref:glycosyltransferase family 52 n=1 Tax=Shewanella indica TaxID=768528 RepID=UPI000C345902|nr:glycosyltransferase family 52 [Shewanella indica]GHB22051.1 hypothetical protein GCM10007107_38220 [Shewanella indica]